MKVGAAKIEITPPLHNPLPLLGWGDPLHVGKHAATPIFSRAVAFENRDGKRLVFVSVEICFISESIRRGVMKRLQDTDGTHSFSEHEVVLTATHTHNAPGGYCHSILYNITSKGYFPEVFEHYVTGITDSIRMAWDRRGEAQLRFAAGEIPHHEPVAFNRSIQSWNANPDTEKFTFKQRHHALHRRMDVLTAVSRESESNGKTVALVSWFAVHCTSMHRDYHAIHSDNKGIASLKAEEHFRKSGEPAIAIFAQGAAGDVSPNYRRFFFKNEVRGAFPDDVKSCDLNGEIQSRYALKLAKESESLQGEELDSILTHHDCTRVPIPPEWVNGQTGLTTGPAALGCPFMGGAAEGGGAGPIKLWLLESGLRFAYWLKRRKIQQRVHGNKVICVEMTEGKVFGDARPEDLPIPSLVDPVIRVIRFWSRLKVFRGEPMTPTIMPIQLFRVGHLGFAAVPGEFTTQSGVRLRGLLAPILKKLGIKEVIVSGYANSYAGYVTTEEEYQLQNYEGACTHFGRYTLLGYMALFRQIARKWVGEPLLGEEIIERPAPELKSKIYLKKIDSELYSRKG